MIRRRTSGSAHRQRGQSIAEFALVVPVIAVMLSAILEFGLAMNADMALEAASREGARIGAVLGNDGTQGVCSGTKGATAEATVDPTILTTVQASLSSAGVDLTIVYVSIFLADTNGNATAGSVNEYKWGTSSFVPNGTHTWLACSRHDGTFGGGGYDDVGVKIQYTYTSKTGLLSFFTGGLPMSAKAVMPIGPPWTLQP